MKIGWKNYVIWLETSTDKKGLINFEKETKKQIKLIKLHTLKFQDIHRQILLHTIIRLTNFALLVIYTKCFKNIFCQFAFTHVKTLNGVRTICISNN